MRSFFLDLLAGLFVLLIGLVLLVVASLGWNAFVNDNYRRTISETLSLRTNVQSFWVEMQKTRSLDAQPSSDGTLADFVLALKKAEQAETAAKNLAAQQPGLLDVKPIRLKPSAYKLTPINVRAYVLAGAGDNNYFEELAPLFKEDEVVVNQRGIDALLMDKRFVPNPVFQLLVFSTWPFLALLWVGLGLLVGIIAEQDVRDRRELLAQAVVKPGFIVGLLALNPPYGLYFGIRALIHHQKQPKNAHAKNIRRTQKLLQKLKGLEQTDAVCHNSEKLTKALDWMEKNPHSSSEELAKQNQQLAREMAADNHLKKLFPEIEKIVTVPIEEEVRVEEHQLKM